jgi:gluconolactonase
MMRSTHEGGIVRDTPTLLISGFNSPEGPAFDRNGNLWFVNWLTSSINRLDGCEPGGTVTEVVSTGGIPAGLAFHPDGTLYIADEGDQWHGVLKYTPGGTLSAWVQTYQGHKLNGANDLVFANDGTLYFSDPWRSSLENPIGGFYRAFPDGRLEQLDTGMAFPNGVAVAPDGSAVYLAETRPNRILRYEIRRDGTVGPRTVFAVLEDPPGPDGMAFDEAGNLYIAHYNGSRVDILDPQGRQTDHVPVPGASVTNVAFGGPDRRTLVITDVATASLYMTRVEIPGLRLFDGT